MLKRPENLTEKQEIVLEKLQEINKPLYQAYLLKEQFYQIYEIKPLEQAKQQLIDWINQVMKTNFQPIKKFCDTLINHFVMITNYFKHGTTSSKIEGSNNKIKVVKRIAFGYSNLDYFFKKIRSKFCNLPRFILLFPT